MLRYVVHILEYLSVPRCDCPAWKIVGLQYLADAAVHGKGRDVAAVDNVRFVS